MYQKIKEAWAEDEDIKVTLDRKSGGGITLVLNKKDIARAKKELRYNRPLKTPGHRLLFAKMISGKTINISQLGNNKPLKEAVKDVRRKMGSKTVKVEWLIRCEKAPEADVVRQELADYKVQIQEMEHVGESSFRRWTTVKVGDDEKENELTIIGTFSKRMGESDVFDQVLAKISTFLKEKYGKIINSGEIKE